MKNILLIVNLFSISLITHAQKTVTIYGKITNPKAEKVFVLYTKNCLTFDMVTADSATLDIDGNFSMTFSWEKPFPASFQHGNETTDLFLTTTDSFMLTLDAEKFDESIKYAGRGAMVNNYLAQKILRNDNGHRNIINASGKMEEKMFTHYIDSLYKEDIYFLKKYFIEIHGKNHWVNDFLDYESAEITYRWVYDKIQYPVFYSYFNKLKTEITLDEKYYDFLNEINLNNPDAISSNIYLVTLKSFIDYELKKAIKKDTTLLNKEKYSKAEEAFIEKTFTGEVIDILIAKMAYKLFETHKNIELGKKILDKYSTSTKNKEFLDILNATYSIALKLAPGNPAPEFSFMDINGKMVSLKDFKGKIVYLDIWASWCGPCRKEIPYAKKLEDEMQGKGVVFLCVSIDQDENAWKKIVKKEKMPGVHLISKGNYNSEITKMYNVNGIPRYILIDKNGNLVNSNANRPSYDVKADIEKLLN